MKNLLLSIVIAICSYEACAQASTTAHLKPTTKPTAQSANNADSKVYICKGSSAYAYHKNKACEGLTYCTRTIVSVTMKEAEGTYKRKPCKACY